MFFCAVLSGSQAFAQSQPQSRITQPVNDNLRVTLPGNVHPLAQPRFDQGAVPDSFAAARMFLLLRRSPRQESALRQFIQDAQTPGNPSYHRWLTPEQFGGAYGPADSDIAAVTSWLQSHGFSVARITKGKTAIEFSGTAGQVRAALGTEIHAYVVNGELHHANNGDPQIPTALAPVVAGITTLNDFAPKSYAELLGKANYNVATHQVEPDWTLNQYTLALAPADFAVQYDLNPVYSAGTKGTGVTIGIISASTADLDAVAAYRSLFGLPPLTLNNIVDGNDPGEEYAVVEAQLDVEVAGAVAPAASINMYASEGSAVQYGINLAAQRAVDDDVAAVLSTSYGECEQDLGSGGNQFWAAVWEQAAAQGQTSFVSSGDGGSAGCDDFDLPQPAQYGLAVNGIGSTSWNVSVGGTDFYYTSYSQGSAAQAAQLATYWNLTPANLPTVSLLKAIPEQVWNNAFGLDLFDNGVYDPSSPTIVAGSGGASSCATGVPPPLDPRQPYTSCTGGYPKPSWQIGTGVPTDGVRDLPDVSLYASNGVNYSFYPICLPFANQCIPQGGGVQISGVGGTSASSPAMAGIMALINQKYGRQGQANFTLYPLAAQHPTAFHDITTGSNDVPCEQGTPSCTPSTLTDNTNGSYTLGQYYAAPGYDLATGLGSVDANLLLEFWTSLKFKSTATTLNFSQTTFTHGTSVNVSVGVAGMGGTPTGDVALVSTAAPSTNTGLGELTLQTGAAAAALDNLPGGQYTVTARYAGDALFAPSASSAVGLNVAPENSTINLFGNTYNYTTNIFNGIANGASVPYGSFITIDAQPVGVHAAPGKSDGIATGTVSFTDTLGATHGEDTVGLDSTGLAEWVNYGGFPVGTHVFAASYSGDASFNATTMSTPLTFTITMAATTANLSASPTSIGLGTPTTLTALVIATDNVPPPTGTITFYFGSTALGTVAVGPDAYNPHVGQSSLNVSSLPLGVDAVTATYNGDSNCNPGTSSAVNITVKQAANISDILTPNPFNEAQSFTLAVTLSTAAGLPAPTGSVGLYGIGGGASYGTGASLVNGSASLTGDGNYFNLGSVTFTVTYYGDANYASVSSTVVSADTLPFSVSGAPVTIAAPGATTGNTSSVMVSPMGGFTGPVTLTCALTGSPAGAKYPPACSILPASVTIAGASAVAATMTINSTAATASANTARSSNGMPRLAAFAGAAVFGILLFGIPAENRRRRSLLSMGLALAMIVGVASCSGGNGGSGGGRGGGISGTTPGNYTFTVTGTTPGPNAGLPTVTANASVIVTIQ